MSEKRWAVTIQYRRDRDFDNRRFELEEIVELDQLVEEGPHFDTINQIVIRRINCTHPGLTIEAAEKL